MSEHNLRGHSDGGEMNIGRFGAWSFAIGVVVLLAFEHPVADRIGWYWCGFGVGVFATLYTTRR